MAIINCPECNKEISDTAKSCPHCGFNLPKKGIGCAGYIFAAVGVVLIFSLLGKSPQDGDKYYSQNSALNSCESYIKARLKNPDSADFDDANAKVYTNNQDNLTIFITVRATNSFNAIVPTSYSCSVSKQNGDWVVQDLQETP